jgi:flagellar basal-body rod modification protein FlgD
MTTSTSSVAGAGQTLNGLLNAKSAANSTTNSTEDRFLKLLVTQMQNQDPLNPMDNAQVTSQIAQINTVNGIDKLNASFSGFSASMLSTQALQATGLIGHGVLATGHSLNLVGGQAIGGIDIKGPADDVVVTITNPAGDTLQTIDLGAKGAGTIAFSWDGSLKAGGSANPGTYSFTVTATQGSQKVDATPLAYGTVGSVGINGSSVILDTDTMGSIAVSDVKRII